jgi:hypothetical protein
VVEVLGNAFKVVELRIRYGAASFDEAGVVAEMVELAGNEPISFEL